MSYTPLFGGAARLPFIVSTALLLLLPCSVEALTLDLVPATPGSNTFDLELIFGIITDSDESTASGTVDLELSHQIVGQDAVVTGFEFTGGTVSFAALSWRLLLIQISGSGIAGNPMTTPTTSTVTDGEFNAAEHFLRVNEGLFDSTLLPEPFAVADMPFDAPGVGTGTIVISEAARDATSITYDTTLTLPIFFNGPVQSTADGDPVNIDLELTGNLVASGQWIVDLPVPGDYNGDGVVDAADYTVWRDSEGQMGAGLPADGDGSGTVDSGDYDLWVANYGGPAPGASIPEPVSGALLAAAGLCWAFRRRGE